MGSLFEELKRRNVFKVAVAYAVMAFLLAQVAQLILPTFNAPQWVLQTLIFLLILGFPLALVLAWAFELTPDGIKADGVANSASNAAPVQDQKLNYITIGLVLLVAGFLLFDRFLLPPDSSSSVNAIAATDLGIETSERVRRSHINLGPMQRAPTGLRTSIALSPDGSRLAYGALEEGLLQLLLPLLSQSGPRPLVGPAATAMFSAMTFSPDGEWLAYVANGNLVKISVASGVVQELLEGPFIGALGIFWAADGTILFAHSGRESNSALSVGIQRLSDTGGLALELDIPAGSSEAEGLILPQLLPGGSDLLFSRGSFPEGMGVGTTVEVFNFATGESRLLIHNAYNARYSSSGHITFMRSADLWAIPFDLDGLKISGEEVRIIEGIESSLLVGVATYTLSDRGDLIYLPGNAQDLGRGFPLSNLSLVDRRGEGTILDTSPRAYATPSLSPDGNQIAVMLKVGNGVSVNIWKYEIDRGTFSPLTFILLAQHPLWSPSGDRVVFSTPTGIGSVLSTGIGELENLEVNRSFGSLSNKLPLTFSPDGAQLFYAIQSGTPSTGVSDIHSLDLTPEGSNSAVLTSEFFEGGARISPDGRWFAYHTNETGRFEIFVRPFPALESGKYPVSSGGGQDPQWAADTGELFYRQPIAGTNTVETYGVSIADDDSFSASIPQLLFTSDHLINSNVLPGGGGGEGDY